MEERRRLGVRDFKRHGWPRPGEALHGSWRWHCGDDDYGSVSYALTADELVLTYTVTDNRAGTRREVRQEVAIEAVPCRYGGHRHYWRCPRCGRRCELVVMAGYGGAWGCRRCLRLHYRSQQLARGDRLQRRAEALLTRLGAVDPGEPESVVAKPKWMRWRTFNRLMDRAVELGNRADAEALSRLCRLGVVANSIEEAVDLITGQRP